LEGKKSAKHVQYRLDRLLAELGDCQIRDITRQDVIAGIEAIALGQKARKDSQAACRRGPDGRKATLVFL